MPFSVKTTGIKEIVEALADRETVKDALALAANQSTNLIKDILTDEPPPLPNQKYVRTGNLSRGVTPTIKMVGFKVIGEVINFVSYTPQVLVFATQSDIHRGRWTTEKEALAMASDKIDGFYEAAGDRIAANINEAS